MRRKCAQLLQARFLSPISGAQQQEKLRIVATLLRLSEEYEHTRLSEIVKSRRSCRQRGRARLVRLLVGIETFNIRR